jgi:hypothetical protein
MRRSIARKLVMQRNALRSIFTWYLAPLIPGLALFLVCGLRAPNSNVGITGAVAAVAIGMFGAIGKQTVRMPSGCNV